MQVIANPEIMAFFRGQMMKLRFDSEDGGGRFSSAGVEMDATPQPPERPIVLHELLLNALHARYLPGGAKNADVDGFHNNTRRGQVYPAYEYVLKNSFEFFAVTASLYLSG